MSMLLMLCLAAGPANGSEHGRLTVDEHPHRVNRLKDGEASAAAPAVVKDPVRCKTLKTQGFDEGRQARWSSAIGSWKQALEVCAAAEGRQLDELIAKARLRLEPPRD